MQNQDHYRIVPLEMSITLISMIIGVGILTIPRGLAQEVGTPDGWISAILGGLLTMLLVFLYTRLQSHFPGKNLIQYMEDGRIGKWIASATSILFIIYFVAILAFEARILSLVVSMYLLINTPTEVIVALILLTTTYAVSKGTQGIIHLNLFFFHLYYWY
jgi:spore germination protein